MNKLGLIVFAIFFFGCTKSKIEEKGFAVSDTQTGESEQVVDGLRQEALDFATKPRNVLLTNNPAHRLTPIYKVNYDKKTNKPFIGTTRFHSNYWNYGKSEGNNWNNNFMPGFEAAFGYNLVNISHYNHNTKATNTFFDQSVLVKTLSNRVAFSPLNDFATASKTSSFSDSVT